MLFGSVTQQEIHCLAGHMFEVLQLYLWGFETCTAANSLKRP